MTGGGGATEVHFIPKKSQLQNLSTQKNTYVFSIPKKSHTNSKLRLRYCWFELL